MNPLRCCRFRKISQIQWDFNFIDIVFNNQFDTKYKLDWCISDMLNDMISGLDIGENQMFMEDCK